MLRLNTPSRLRNTMATQPHYQHSAFSGQITEIVVDGNDFSAMPLLLPLLAQLSQDDRWLAWVAPPASLPRELLEQAGIDLSKVMLLKPDQNRDQLDLACQALRTGTCHAVISWAGYMANDQLKELEMAAAAGESQGIIIRNRNTAG